MEKGKQNLWVSSLNNKIHEMWGNEIGREEIQEAFKEHEKIINELQLLDDTPKIYILKLKYRTVRELRKPINRINRKYGGGSEVLL